MIVMKKSNEQAERDRHQKIIYGFMGRQQYEECANYVEGLLQTYKNDPWLLNRLARANFFMKNDEVAIKCIKKALKFAPRDPFIINSAAEILIYSYDFSIPMKTLPYITTLTTKQFLKLSEVGGNKELLWCYADSFSHLALCHLCFQQYQQAVSFYNKYLELYEAGIKGAISLAEVRRIIKRIPVLQDLYNTVRQSDACWKRVKYARQKSNEISEKTNKLKEREEYASLRSYLQSMVLCFPDDYWLHIELAMACHACGEYAEALKYSQIAFRIAPYDPLIIDDHAMILFSNKKWKKSLALWESLVQHGLAWLENHPNSEGKRWAAALYRDAHAYIGYCHEQLGNKQEAVMWFTKHLALRKPGSSSEHVKKTIEAKIEQLSN